MLVRKNNRGKERASLCVVSNLWLFLIDSVLEGMLPS